MTAHCFRKGLFCLLARSSLTTKAACLFITIVIGLYFAVRTSLPSYKGPAKITSGTIKNQFTGSATRANYGKYHFLDPNSHLSEPDATFCMTLSDIYSLKMYLNQGDKIATAKLFDRGACTIIRPCPSLQVVEEKGDIVHVQGEGIAQTFWTFRGSLEISRK